ncbi:hypothetical protein D9M71_729690 [compost metagenome]
MPSTKVAGVGVRLSVITRSLTFMLSSRILSPFSVGLGKASPEAVPALVELVLASVKRATLSTSSWCRVAFQVIPRSMPKSRTMAFLPLKDSRCWIRVSLNWPVSSDTSPSQI